NAKTIAIGRLAQSPTLKDTWLYAFRSAFFKSEAYQAFVSDLRPRFTMLGNAPATFPLNAPLDLARPVQLTEQVQFPLSGDRRTFPNIGGKFTGSGAELIANSEAGWNGESYTISITIGRNNSDVATNITAPFAAALNKAGSVSDFLLLVQEMRNAPLSFRENVFDAKVTFKAEAKVKALYVIEQPITFQRSDGRVCFKAPVYSPIPIPEKFLSCDLR